MKRSLDHPIRKANPGTFQSDQEVIRQFVVRNRELDTVLEVLRGNMAASSCQHVLLVAPRGRGKTMLLARVAAELRTNTDLSRYLLPVRFMEESLEIFDVADFWLECLFYLARESAVGDPELTRELRETHSALAARGRGEELIEARARAAVLNAADRLGKQLVLMVENLQDLCSDVDEDFGWKLREALQSQPEIMLLATATSRFKGLDDATQPFFELFRTLGLDPLAIEECQRLWHVVSGDAVGEREARPLQILTGGSPRLFVFVADFARHGSLRQLMEQLVRLIDEHTEYFRTHLEGFAKTERRVYLATIDLWQPSTTGEITARARLDVRIVSNMLGRLVHRGAVMYEGSGRKRRYSAVERLYGIYYKLRRERDEETIVRNLIHFMAAFYSRSELSEMSERLSMEAVQMPAIREGIDRVIAEAPRKGDTISSEVLSVLGQARDQAAEKVQTNRLRELYDEIADARKENRFEETIKLSDRFLASSNDGVHHASASSIVTVALTRAVAKASLGEFGAAMASFDALIERFEVSDSPKIQVQVAAALVSKGIAQGQLGDWAAEVASCEEVVERYGASESPDLQVKVAMALFCKGIAQGQLGDWVAAVATCEDVVERYGDSDSSDLQVQVARALVNAGFVQIRIGRTAEALLTSDALKQKYGSLKDLDDVGIDWQAMRLRTKALLHQGDRHAVLEAFQATYVAFRIGKKTMLREMLDLALELIIFGVSEGELAEIMSSDRERADALAPLVVALRKRAGEPVRAPVEVIDVADDILIEIEAKMCAAGGVHPETAHV